MNQECVGLSFEPYVIIFESELKLIAANAADWGAIETGGDLFGAFTHAGRPLILLASPPGQRSVHQTAHFQQDPDFTRWASDNLVARLGIQYIGNHHSHHSLGIHSLSMGDIQSAQSFSMKNGFRKLCQLLVTFDGERPVGYWSGGHSNQAEPASVTVHAFYYNNAGSSGPTTCPIRVLPGVSPVRQSLGFLRPPFEFKIGRGKPAPKLNYQPIQSKISPTTSETDLRRQDEADSEETLAEEFLTRLSREIYCLPQPVKQRISYRQQGEVFIVSLPVQKNYRLVLKVAVKRNWVIEGAFLGSLQPGGEVWDLTEWMAEEPAHGTVHSLYYEVRRQLRGIRCPTLGPANRKIRPDKQARCSWPHKIVSLLKSA